MTKHTQGTWTAEHDADGDFGIFWGNTHICTTVSDTTEDEANAHLIAAAPELLDALKAMLLSFYESEEGLCLECGEGVGTGAGCESCHVFEKANQAIAKAEGK